MDFRVVAVMGQKNGQIQFQGALRCQVVFAQQFGRAAQGFSTLPSSYKWTLISKNGTALQHWEGEDWGSKYNQERAALFDEGNILRPLDGLNTTLKGNVYAGPMAWSLLCKHFKPIRFYFLQLAPV